MRQRHVRFCQQRRLRPTRSASVALGTRLRLGQPGWDRWRAWHAAKPLWIAATVLAFIFWWPIGLAILFFGLWSKRMGFWGCGRYAGWQGGGWQRQRLGSATTGAEDRAAAMGRVEEPLVRRRAVFRGSASSGNRAFDEYRAETLRRLEEEQKRVPGFLDRLRFAKDKAEFDQFMAERRNRPPAPPQEPAPE